MAFCLLHKVFVFSSFLVLRQGYADFSVSGISQSLPVVPALPPIGEEISGDVSLSPSLTNGTILNPLIASPPPISAPGPKPSKGFTPDSHSNGPISTPQYNYSLGSVPVSSPSNNPDQKPQYPEHPIVIPEAPVPVGLPSYQSPPSPPPSIPPIPLLEPPSADQNTPPPVPMSPGVNEPPPRIIPLPSPPVHSVEPVVVPPIPPEPGAPTPTKSEATIPPPPPTLPTEPPSISSSDITPTPTKSNDTLPPPQPILPIEPPSNPSGDIAPTPSKSEETFAPPQPTLPLEPPSSSSGDIAPTPSKSEGTFPPPQPTLPIKPPPNTSGDIAPTPTKSKYMFPPPQPTLPTEPPPISPGDIAPTPSKSEDVFPPPQPTLPTEPPPNSSGDIAPTPSKSEDTFPPPQPTLPTEPPTNSSGKHNSHPIPSPNPGTAPGRSGKLVAAPPYLADGRSLPANSSSPTHDADRGINPGRAAKPVAVPLNRTGNLHPSISPLPTNVPSSHEGKGNINRAPPPPLYPMSSPYPILQPPEAVPSTSAPSPPKPVNEAAPPVSPVKDVPRHASPKKEPEHPRTNIVLHASPPPPWKTEGDESPVPSSVSISPPWRNIVPVKSPEVTHSHSPTMFPKMPFQALPPPPPNEDCATLTCSEPLTIAPSGCRCVLPIQVGLRLGVALYTFFPLVSELAAEISAGDFLEQNQVRIMGANEASQDPQKTIVLTDLVPLGEKFDNITANLIFQRFWHKQVYIKNSLFGSYEVLYVRYPGLPPSPPAATPDIDVIANDPYHNHENSSRTTKPLGVDVSRIKHSPGLNKGIIAIIVLSASLAIIVFCTVLWVFLFKDRGFLCHSHKTPPAPVSSLSKSSAASAPGSASISLGSSIAAYTGSMRTFSSSEIVRATDSFNKRKVLGEGGFGLVYRGELDDGTEVAVKVIKRDDNQSGREFLAEVEMLSRLHHRNLVKLIGICIEEHSRCLVYELVPGGSVESRLHDEGTAPLDWTARLKIALGAARGLAYLHEDSSPRVIHRDFKASNILLEHDNTPKVSDFGLARAALDEENRHISTRVMGTFGYVAPEYAMTGHLLVKSDVYSYGVVLLELLTGKKPVDMSQQPGQESLVSWARPLLTSKEGLELIIDQSLGPNFPLDSIAKVAAIASMCVQPEVSNRPFMGEVVQALKLVCNECEETRELGSRSCSREDISVIDASSDCEVDPHCSRSYDSGHDVERGFSVSELLSSSQRSDRIEHNSLRRHSSSGPSRTTNTRWPWQNMRRSSGGSISEHHMMYKLWPRNI